MKRIAYAACLSASLCLYVTVFAPTSRPHHSLLLMFPYHLARGMILALPVVAIALIAIRVSTNSNRRFPDALAAFCFLAAAIMLYGFSLTAGYPPLNFQLLAIPGFAGLALWSYISDDRRRRTG